MKLALNTPVRKRTAAALFAVCAFLYVGQASRVAIASWLGSRADLKSLQRAASLDSDNADYRDHLGRFYDLVNRDPASAVNDYRAAVQLNPHSARYWFDLAGAYQVLGDTANQAVSLERAIAADSMTPDVAWEAANLYLVQGENQKALREFRVVLANDSSLAATTIQFCWRIDPDVDSLLRDVVPQNADAYIAFLGLLKQQQQTEGTFKVWDALIESHQSFEVRYAYDYIHYLILHKEVDEAVKVWQDAVPRFGLTSYLPAPNNLVINGKFSLDILNAGFDWQYQKQSGVQLTLDSNDFHAGRRSMMITFDGPGISDAGIFQYIPVQPNTTYEFSGYYKNGEMEGAGAPHLTIQDMYSLAIYYDSDELRDAGFWKSAEGEFTTGPDCKLLVLHVRRLPAGSPIRGKLWINDFHLVRKQS